MLSKKNKIRLILFRLAKSHLSKATIKTSEFTLDKVIKVKFKITYIKVWILNKTKIFRQDNEAELSNKHKTIENSLKKVRINSLKTST